jgi:uncharacterized Zn finger protein
MIQPCPICGEAAQRLLEDSSRGALVNYYRCDWCATVWNKPKEADAPVRIVGTRSSQPTQTKAVVRVNFVR